MKTKLIIAIVSIVCILWTCFIFKPKNTEPTGIINDTVQNEMPHKEIIKTVWEDDSNQEEIYKLMVHAEFENQNYVIPDSISWKIKYGWNGKKISKRGGLILYNDTLFIGCSPKDYTEYVFKDNIMEAICDGTVYNIKVKEYNDQGKFWRFDKMYIIPKKYHDVIMLSKNVIIESDSEVQNNIVFLN